MDGARLILNARYFHIAQPSEKATKYAFVAEAAAGLVNYIATRESVIYNYDEHYKEVDATEAQRETINQFLDAAPDIELSREYKAYYEDRSAANASALISRAAQYVYGATEGGDIKSSAPATRAQRERIREFVDKVPAIRQTPEYIDYKASPTRENASEVLSHALEVGLANAADPETLKIMLNYIAERPGVVHNEGKVHGLFTVNGAADLAAEKEAIAAHTGNIYSMIFSLRREDADRLGYDRQEAWSQLFAIKADKIAQALRVPTSNLHWVAAVHNTKHHPHAHFIAYSTDQKSRIYLSEDAIEQLKSEFVSEIFAEERHQIFAPREEARQQLEDRLEALFTQLEQNSDSAVANLRLPEKFTALRKSIESASGRHVYKYLPKDTKAMVDKLLDEISEVPEIKELLTEYNKYQQQLEAYYKTPDEPKPLSAVTMRSNLYPLKNLVVQCALQFDPSPPLPSEIGNSSAKTGSTSGFSYEIEEESESTQINEPYKVTWQTYDTRNWRDNMQAQGVSPLRNEPPYTGTADDKYRYAQHLRYDEKRPQDAILWYNLAEQLGHTEAAYQLAQYYLQKGEDQDIELGNYYLLKAKLGFEDTLLNSINAMQLHAISAGSTYADAIADFGPLETEEKKQQRAISRAAYFLGRIYITGIEIASIDGIESEDLPALQVETDPYKAAAYLEFAYNSGYKHAAYYLGNLYSHGKLSPTGTPDYEQAASWYIVDGDNPYCQSALAKISERLQDAVPGNTPVKTGSTSGFSFDEESESTNMTWQTDDTSSTRNSARTQRHSTSSRRSLYDEMAEEKYWHAQHLRYDAKSPKEAIEVYKEAEQLGHPEAAYQLAQYYLQKGANQNVKLGNYYLLRAKLGFEKALLNSNNALHIQAISNGSTYRDTIEAFGTLEMEDWNQKRALNRAAYYLGRIYITGIEISNIEGIEPEDIPALQVATDPQKAAAYFEFAYSSGYKHAAYYLGNLHFRGKLSPTNTPDYEEAINWYKADENNAYCKLALAKMTEHGQGFTPDAAAAEVLYRECLEANDYVTAEAAYAIAQMQHSEQLPLTDMQELYKKAAEIWLKDEFLENHNHIPLRLARMYEYGLGVPEDLSLAVKYYKLAVKTAQTEYKLGQLMQRIGGDAAEIYAHYAAARVGMLYAEEHRPASATAQQAVRLATMYRYGLGCDADRGAAVHWYTVAAARGSVYAQQRLEVMEAQRIRQEQQQNLSFAARLLNTIGNALRRQTLRDQQSVTATTDRRQRRMQRRLKRALGQRSDYENIIQ